MAKMNTLASLFLEFEEKILHQAFSDEISSLLAQDFWEIGDKGVVHSRAEVCQWLQGKVPESRWDIRDFKVQLLAEDIALCSYRARQSAPKPGTSAGSLRSSVWKKNSQGLWQMVFHQATKVH